MEREPVLTIGTITAVVTAVVGLLVSFGVTISDTQQAAVLGCVAVLAPLLVAFLSRQRVTPTADPRDDDGTALVRADEQPRHRG